MSDRSSDAAAGYADAAKWLVGLSGAVLAGVFLHPEFVIQRSEKMRIYLAIVLFFFGLSIIGGVVYLFWINWVRRQQEKLDESLGIPFAAVALPASPTPEEPGKEKVQQVDPRKQLEAQQKEMDGWYKLLLYSFCGAVLFGMIAFCVWVAWPQDHKDQGSKPPVVVGPLRFTITQSAVHKTNGGMQAHTFLLNQQTGEVWQMVCDAKGNVVSFQRVLRRDANGNPEKDKADVKP